MKYIDPKTETLSVTYDDIVYSYDYYKPAIKITGVVDESYSNWLVGSTYALGDYVIVPELKRIYRSAIASNLGNFPLASLGTKWIDYGGINSFRMFATDSDIGAQTTGTDGILEFDFSQSNSIVGIDLDFISIDVMLIKTDGINYLSDYVAGTTYAIDDAVIYNDSLYISLTGGNIGNTPDVSPSDWVVNTDRIYFDEQILGSSIACSTYGEYFYTSKTILTRKILTGLEWLPESILRMSFTGAFKIGTLGYDNINDFGATLSESNLRYQSTSKISTNEFTGFRTVLRFGVVRLLDVDVIFEEDLFGNTSNIINGIIDKNIIWIPDTNEKFTEAISIGYIEDFELPMNNSTHFKTTARIVGVSK